MATGAVVLEERVERAIVWLFCVGGGVGENCLMEEEVVSRLRRWFAAWKVRDGLKSLQAAGVTVPVSRWVDGYNRRCWQIAQEAWSRLEPVEPVEPVEVVL